VIDLGAVTLLDSSGIQAIVSGYPDAVRAGAEFTIGPAHHRIVPVLEHTGLRDALTAAAHREAAADTPAS
jgi:anti-anti-sigma regulatory factor